MGKRLTQIATRTGDDGTTGLGDNTRVAKDSLRVQAMGDVDELNSHIGLLLCETMPDAVRALLIEVQHQLFNLGGELSIPGFELLKAEALAVLERRALKFHGWATPGANSRAAGFDVARTTARRAERRLTSLPAQNRTIRPELRQFVNRLSDLLWLLAREAEQ